MMQLLKTTCALTLAINIVAPSVYLGSLPPVAHAIEINAGDLTGVITAATPELAGAAAQGAVCVTSVYWAGLLANLPFVGEFLAPLVSTGEAGEAELEVRAGELLVPENYLLVDASTVAQQTNVVPVGDKFIAEILSNIGVQLNGIGLATNSSAKANSATSINSGNLTFKECVLDPLLWALRDVFLRAITDDIIAWIEGGFEGTPAFLIDPEDFFLGVADTVLQDYLYDAGLDQFLCEPFSLDVIFGISMDYNRPAYGEWGTLSCRLDEIFPGIDINIDTDGDGVGDTAVTTPDGNAAYDAMVNRGTIYGYGLGVDAYDSLVEPNNNMMGQTVALGNEVVKSIAKQQGEEGMKLDQNKGWFSLKCDVDDDFIKDGVCTPGEFVAGHINNYTNSGLTELTIADEFSEILNALFAALVKELLSAVSDGDGLGLRR